MTTQPFAEPAKTLTRLPSKLPMTPARWLTLVIAFPVLLALIGFTGLSAVADIGLASFPVHDTVPVRDGQVSMQVASGNITLHQAASATGAELTATAHYSLLRPTVTTSGGTVQYRCRNLLGLGDCELDGTLQVPAGTAVGLSTAGGDVTVPSFAGAQLSLQTGGGNLTAGTLSGRVSLQSSGGDMTANTLAGSLDASLGGGNLTVASMSAATTSIRSSGGDVDLSYTTAPNSLDITSGGGNVDLVLPPGHYRVDAEADGGNVTNMAGNDGSATRTINVHSSGGDITIR